MAVSFISMTCFTISQPMTMLPMYRLCWISSICLVKWCCSAFVVSKWCFTVPPNISIKLWLCGASNPAGYLPEIYVGENLTMVVAGINAFCQSTTPQKQFIIIIIIIILIINLCCFPVVVLLVSITSFLCTSPVSLSLIASWVSGKYCPHFLEHILHTNYIKPT